MTAPVDLLRSMTRIRMVEEEIAKRYPKQQMRCPVHLSIGQEAAAVGVCAALQTSDWAFSGHRNHAHYLAKGGNLKAMIAEIYGKVSGCCGGKGGSMHLSDLSAGFIASTPIVASTIPIAVGAALTAQRENLGRLVVVFLGDGAIEAGVVHESFNFASLKGLPILFICENNLYSVYSPLEVRQPSRSLGDLAAAHGIRSLSINGNDAVSINSQVIATASKIRAGDGPAFMELPTYRWLEHCGPNDDTSLGYRDEAEVNSWINRDPLKLMEHEYDVSLMPSEIHALRIEIQQCFDQAINDPKPEIVEASSNVYSNNQQKYSNPEEDIRLISFAQAVREAQDFCLTDNASAYVMGLGVPDPKGIFGTTSGLQSKHGKDRVFDIPLSEHAMTGVAIGSAITGLRPILTHQRLDFALVSIDQIVNQAAKWHYMFNGRMSVPLVIRMIVGRGWGQGPQHSQSLQSWFAHIPGLSVVMPSCAYDAKGLLISAFKSNNPTIFIENRWLHEVSGFVPKQSYTLPLEKAKIRKTGIDITLIGMSYTVLECVRASEILEKIGISCEVLDLISARPLDHLSIFTSVRKTCRVIIVEHADEACSLSSQISAIINENCFENLKCAPKRITSPSHPCPTSHFLSKTYYPGCQQIARAVLKMINKTINKDQEDLINSCSSPSNHDQPSKDFLGPF